MKKPTAKEITSMICHCRKLCDTDPDVKVQRIAQAMMLALIWATRKTDWKRIKDEPVELAKCLAVDLKEPR